jgi:hypothetical protein
MDWSKFLDISSTLAAAFAGSWSAFKLNTINTKNQAASDEIDAANRTLFRLGRQYNTLLVIRLQHLEQYRQSPTRHITLRPIAMRDYSADHLDQDSLQFLLRKEQGELLFNLLLENDRFITSIETINARSAYHDAVIQPALERAGEIVSLDIFEKSMGLRATTTIKNYTDDVYRLVDEACGSISRTMQQFHLTMKELYPQAKFVMFKADEVDAPRDIPSNMDYSWRYARKEDY